MNTEGTKKWPKDACVSVEVAFNMTAQIMASSLVGGAIIPHAEGAFKDSQSWRDQVPDHLALKIPEGNPRCIGMFVSLMPNCCHPARLRGA